MIEIDLGKEDNGREIPKWVTSQQNKVQGMQVVRLRESVEKYLALKDHNNW